MTCTCYVKRTSCVAQGGECHVLPIYLITCSSAPSDARWYNAALNRSLYVYTAYTLAVAYRGEMPGSLASAPCSLDLREGLLFVFASCLLLRGDGWEWLYVEFVIACVFRSM